MKKIGIGIVGAGFAGELHARAIRVVGGTDAEIIGVASRGKERAEAFAQRFAIRHVFSDYTRMLASDEIDVVSLCIPNNIHKEFAIQAARAGKHIVCEKPLTGYFGEPGQEEQAGATSRARMREVALRDSDEILAAVQENDVKLMYAENWVYAPAIERARQLIKASGGAVFEMRGEESHHGSHSPYSKHWRYTGGGALIRIGSHPIGAMLHLKRWEGIWRDGRPVQPQSVLAEVAELTTVRSFQQNDHSWIVRDWNDVETWSTVLITFDDGTKGVVSASDVCLGGIKDTLDVFLSNARIHCNLSRSNMVEVYAPSAGVFADEYFCEKLETKAGWNFPNLDEHWALGYEAELRDFISAVKDNREPLADAELSRDVMNVIYSAYLSAEEGRRVLLDEGTNEHVPNDSIS